MEKKVIQKVLLAGGGSGGHIFAAEAVAQAFAEYNPQTQFLFVGAKRGLESSLVPKMGIPLILLKIEPLKGMSKFEKLKSLVLIPWALARSLGVLLKFRPQVVLGVGGYASGPMLLMARLIGWLWGCQVALLEPNIQPGLTNRILGKWVHWVFTSFEDSKDHFIPKKCVLVGNPIRRQIRASLSDRTMEDAGKDKIPSKSGKTLFVFGGSQGAVGLNKLVLNALASEPELSQWVHDGELQIIHQTGPLDFHSVQDRYAQLNMDEGPQLVIRPFIHEMQKIYKMTDLVICRGGMGSITELTLVGKPAIIIPLPTSADNHQFKNAKALENQGAAQVWDQNEMDSHDAGKALLNLLGDSLKRESMGKSMQTQNRGDAADRIAQFFLRPNQ